ncbi:MAG TPA: tetratricopeptide repeat protein [Lentimicrobium sp.]|nr:tetratricopeptide repeat protein [Lentimicrobium sp.]
MCTLKINFPNIISLLAYQFRHFILFLILGSTLVSSANDSTDSLRHSLNTLKGTEKARVLLKLANQCLYTDASLSKSYTNEAYLIAFRKNDQLLMAQCLIQQGLWLNTTGSYDSAIKTLNKALYLINWPAESTDLARLYTVKGISNENAGYSDSALFSYQQAFSIYKNSGHHQGLANTYLNLGCLFLKLKNYDQAATHLQRALGESIKYKTTATLGSIYNNLGILYDIRGNKIKALDFYRKALDIEEKAGNKAVMATIYHNIALIHDKQGYHQKALDELKKSVELKLITGNREGTANSYVEMAQVYLNIDNVDQAALFALKALQLAEESNFTYVEANCRKQLADIYERKGDYKKSASEWRKALTLNDSLYNQSVSREISELQSKYEILQKEQENKILKQQITLQEVRTSQQKIYFRFMVFAVIASTLVLIMVFILLRLKMTTIKKNKELFDKEYRLKELELAAKENAYRLLENEKKQEEIRKAYLLQQLKAEQEIKALELKNLNTSIQLKNKELTSLSANFINVNDILGQIRKSLFSLKKHFNEVPSELDELLSLVNSNMDNDMNWRKFRMSFEETHAGFLDLLISNVPELTLNEQKLCAYLFIGLSSNDIARVMNISLAAVNKNRQRLRKTLGLAPNADITDYLKSIDLQRQPVA